MTTSTVALTQAQSDYERLLDVCVDPRRPEVIELTVLMPCLNEVRTLGRCIEKARQYLARENVKGEIVIADNGSTDGSQALAASLGARVVDVPTRGYGAALIAGIDAARGRYVIMGDSDDSYDFSDLSAYLSQLRRGYELVMGNRFEGGIRPGAMPALHRYLGNPVLSFIGRVLYRAPIKDFHCGLRGFDRKAMLALKLRCTGMEFASEMIVKASLHGLRMVEVPTVLSPDGRDRPPHLRSWRDGWRHLRFLLLFSPRWLFLYPGVALLTAGLGCLIWLWPGPRQVGSLQLDIHTMLYALAVAMVGAQLCVLAICAKVFAVGLAIHPPSRSVSVLKRWLTFEVGLVGGVLLLSVGLGFAVESLLSWERVGYGGLNPSVGMRSVIPALGLAMAGVQLLLTSMFVGVLELRTHQRPTEEPAA
jgi:hypothetical protein